MKLSIVSTLYKSSQTLREFHRRLSAVAAGITADFEVVLVVDGSPDDTLEIACDIANGDSRVKVVDLARNFGEHKARMTGIRHAIGDLIFLISADLETEPELLTSFYEKMLEAPDVDLVLGVQEQRRGAWFERLGGFIFYRMLNLLSPVKVAASPAGCHLMRRRFATALLQHEERSVFYAGLIAATGFKQLTYPITKRRRQNSSYSLASKIKLAVDALTSYTAAPLYAIFYLGLAASAAAFGCLVYVAFKWAVTEARAPGWLSLMASIWLIGGILMSTIGLIGIYLARVFDEVKRRPYTIVRGIHERERSVQ